MERLLEPELLDHLPPLDLRAARSRMDLRRVNEWMGNPRMMATELQKYHFRTVLELGAGDGNFMFRLAELTGLRGIEATLVDQQASFDPSLTERFGFLGWKVSKVQSDVFDYLSRPTQRFDLVLCNLFLHHFSDGALREMFRLLKVTANIFLAFEPRRARFALAMAKLLWVIRCNAVTRHDAVISVRAGFRDRELAGLWEQDADWKVFDGRRGFCGQFFSAAKARDCSPEL